jgi:NAD(P)-dependent dehydrogenase (short-subunit alcohol dehydrogenase family)
MTQAVLVTGASTGIGFACSKMLAKNGFRVFACVRKEEDFAVLVKESSNIVPIICDVTRADQINDAVMRISNESFVQFHLVNNAGIAIPGPIETLTVNDFRLQFEVNFFGVIAVTQAFLPMLKKTRGRIVNISSVSGLSSSPFLAAYSASKFALEAFSDSLRWELGPCGVKVIIVEPGPIATPIWKKGFIDAEKMLGALSGATLEYYRLPVERFSRLISSEIKLALPAERVSAAVEKALTDKSPPARLLVVSPAVRLQGFIQRALPSRLIDKNIEKALFKNSPPRMA